ncbi:protein kinase domain-containing protein [Candidatus Oscillochloris fontis]|uniref:protein kinase domain-containing protein n=1 Tax=Candidatus Oscillochloris fontis TaxID=2496868 RepID=UPI0013754641|nr:tetratricopeptide repeat protein [Candidatus Oscillochloris fontis]
MLPTCGACGHHNRNNARYCGRCGVLLLRERTTPPLGHVHVPMLRSGDLLAHGRYRIDRALGGGGFSQVFLAEDTHLNRLCAMKQLRLNPAWPPEQIADLLAAFPAEALLLANLSTPGHRHLPDVYDHLDSHLCLVMKYVAGESLATMMARREDPLPEREALGYVRDACSALVYLHARKPAVLHRDIKPANLIRDVSGRVVLIDFGLAGVLRHDTDAPLATAGTPAYMPPEQLRGLPEPRSDVYALGATLYYLLTRQIPPRLASAPIPPLHTSNPHVRPEVEALVRRTLARAPVERPSAAQLLAELDELLEQRNLPPPEPEHPPTPPRLVGRTADLCRLQDALAQNGAVALVGMPGAGKTALAATFAQQVPATTHCFWHSFRNAEGPDVLIWRLAGWLAHLGQPDTWQRLQGARQSGGPPLSPELLASYLVQQMRGWNGLICLDDLHLAEDAALLRVIGVLIDAAHAAGLRLLATARTIPTALRGLVSLSLAGLAEEAACELVVQKVAGIDHQQAQVIAQATEGNAQFLTLAIAALKRGVRPAQLVQQLMASDDLGEYLLREVDAGLSSAERKLMEALALLQGYGGDQDVLSVLTGGRSVLRTLAGLLKRHLLSVEQRASGSLYRQHAIVQGFYYRSLPVRRRKTLHARAADYYADEVGDYLAAGRHFAHADLPVRVAAVLSRNVWSLINAGHGREVRTLLSGLPFAQLEPELRAAARSALGELCAIEGEYAEAQALIESAIADSPAQDVRQARRQRLLAQIAIRTGEYAQAESHCRQGLELAATNGPIRSETARIYSQLAEALMRQSSFDAAEAACAAGLAALPPAPANPGERAALLMRQATLIGRRGAYAAAITRLEESLELVQHADDTILSVAILHNLGRYHQVSGQIDDALVYFNRSLRLVEQIGDLARRLITINSLGAIFHESGDHESAARYYHECRVMSEQFGIPAHHAFALLNLGMIAYEQSELDSATQHLQQARTIFGQLGVRDEESHCLYVLGDIALRQSDPQRAQQYAQQALDLATQIGSQVFISCALRVRGEAQIALGDLGAAEQDLGAAQQLQDEIGDPYDATLIQAALAHLAAAQGECSRARSTAEMVIAFAHERGMAYLVNEMQTLVANLEKRSGSGELPPLVVLQRKEYA